MEKYYSRYIVNQILWKIIQLQLSSEKPGLILAHTYGHFSHEKGDLAIRSISI